MPAPETSLRPKKRPESIEASAAAAAALAAEEAAVKRGNNAAARRASQDKELRPDGGEVKKFGDGGMTTPKPRGCGAAQMSGFRGGETY